MACRAFASTTCRVKAPARVVRAAVARPARAQVPAKQEQAAVDPVLAITTTLVAPLLAAGPVFAADEEGHNILKGTSLALIHPAIMITLFTLTVYAGWLGLQWRETRTIGDKIKEKKKELPAKDSEGNRPSSPIESEISQLEDKRKELTKGNFKDRHHRTGAILLGFGTVIAIEGCLNTYTRAGKLFPGPHLYAGAGIVALWAIAAALVPAMNKGSDTARSVHIAANTLNLGLFAWQIPTGWAIVQKVFQFTSFP